MHGHESLGNAHVRQRMQKPWSIWVWVGHQMSQDANEKNVACAFEQGRLAATWVTDLLLNQGHGHGQRRFMGVGKQVCRLRKLFH